MVENDAYLERLVDEAALQLYLERELGAGNAVDVRYHDEGHSNETLFIEWGDETFVMRRPPAGETAERAHDVLREYRIIDALEGTSVPVPDPVLACEDTSVIGGEFYLMTELDGTVIRDDEPERFATPERRTQLGETLIDTLAEIHTIDYEAVGLGDLGYPEGYTERQVERWGKQFDWAYETTEAERPVPHIDEIGDWLEANVPDEYEHRLVHGDYKLDNVMFAPGTPPEINAVLDWEMGTLGDPLTDIGWLLCYWDTDPLIPDLMPMFLDRPGYPTRRELIDRYEHQSGLEFSNPRFYVTLGLYMLIGVCEMFYARYLNGNSNDDLYPKMGSTVPELSERAMAVIEGRWKL
jgi:aminoglycoside phosphotransferase (APT) family kinase protein